MTNLMPAIFLGHGNPMNALSSNSYTDAWAALGKSVPRPKAILSVSAHWYTSFSAVTSMPYPRTIHDFGGFPEDLYEVQYPAPGDPKLAKRIKELIAPIEVASDKSWGLDHGTWSVLRHVFPDADIPIVQLSIDKNQTPSFHYEIGKRLMPLREEGVLFMGSGNIVHNLRSYDWDYHNTLPFDWALRFEKHVRACLHKFDDLALVDYLSFGQDAALSVPTPDHYLPFLYVLGLRDEKEAVSFPVEGVDGRSVSMLAVRLG